MNSFTQLYGRYSSGNRRRGRGRRHDACHLFLLQRTAASRGAHDRRVQALVVRVCAPCEKAPLVLQRLVAEVNAHVWHVGARDVVALDAGEVVVAAEPALLDAVFEAALKHAVARDLAQVNVRILPELLGGAVLLEQRLLPGCTRIREGNPNGLGNLLLERGKGPTCLCS